MNPEIIPYPDPPSLDDLNRILENSYGLHSEPFLVYIGPGSKTKSVSYYITYDGQLFARDKRITLLLLPDGVIVCEHQIGANQAVPLSLISLCRSELIQRIIQLSCNVPWLDISARNLINQLYRLPVTYHNE